VDAGAEQGADGVGVGAAAGRGVVGEDEQDDGVGVLLDLGDGGLQRAGLVDGAQVGAHDEADAVAVSA